MADLWFVDPDMQMLEAFVLGDVQWLLLDTLTDADAVPLAPFDAISFSLGDLWPADSRMDTVPPKIEFGDMDVIRTAKLL